MKVYSHCSFRNAAQMANGDQQFIDRCKLDLGDAYL
jgi:hypothetical protein